MNQHNAHPDEDPLPSDRPATGSSVDPTGTSDDGSGNDPSGSHTSGGDTSGTARSGEPGPYPDAGSHHETGPLPAPPLYPNAQPPYPQSQSQSQNFFTWVRGQGIQRGRDRWIGGVASGVAHRLGVDPLIVRGIFIVLTIFAGMGVLLYGLAWALLPEPDGRIHVQEAAAGRWSTGMTGALITTVIGFPSLGSGVWGWGPNGFGGFVWTIFWIAAAIYVIYYLSQRDKTRNGAPLMNTSPQPGSPSGTAAFGATSPGAPYGTTQQYGTPYSAGTDDDTYTGGAAYNGPAYDGGAATPAPYSPSPYSPYGESHRPYGGPGATPPAGPTPPSGPNQPYGGGFGGAPVPSPAPKARNMGPGAPAVAVTAGLALLVGGGIKALEALNVINLGDATNAVVWASGAAVLGLGILIAGLRGRTSGILGFFAVVALIIGGIFNIVPNGDRFRFQEANWNPASIEQAKKGFDITGGSGTADLTRLNLTPPLSSTVVIPLDVTASNLTVIIPDTVPVQIRADMTMGNLNQGSQNHGGMTTQQSNYNTDKPGAALILEIDGTMSNITIQEGN
jgi:phage shock protein PspC (stress-responsive transcriptional regulator)